MDKLNFIRGLLSEDTTFEKKVNIFLKSAHYIQELCERLSYYDMIQEIIPIMEQNIETLESKNRFSVTELQEYVKKFEIFWHAYMKYQVWIIGDAEGCKSVKAILNYDRVHLLGEGYSDKEDYDEVDYIIVTTKVSDDILANLKKDKIVRYDILRSCSWYNSPESAYIDFILREKLKSGIEGVMTGLSYQQRGVLVDRLKGNFACLATPSQDLFVDFHSFLWVYHQVVNRKKGNIKFCIVGMDFYRLWYDLSLSFQKERMLCYYNRIKCMHHFHEFDYLLADYEKDLRICHELMVEGFMDKDFVQCVHPEQRTWERNQEYQMTEEIYRQDAKQVKKLFHKPYPKTFEENVGILESYLKFLNIHNVKTLVLIPPFPKIFNDFMDLNMKKETLNVLADFQAKFGFDLIDLSDNEIFINDNSYFADYCHLNRKGAELVTKVLNDFIGKNWVESVNRNSGD